MCMKKIGAFLLAGCLLCVGAQILPEQNAVSITAKAAATFEYEGLQYADNNTYAVLTGLARGNDNPEIIIPAKAAASDGTELKVTQIKNGSGGFFSSPSGAFSSQDTIEKVTCGENLMTIGSYAFWGCNSLQSVTFSDSLQTIGAASFSKCIALPSVTFPASLKTIEQNAFDGCSALTDIQFNEGLETIGAWAFEKCNALESVTLPASLKTLDGQAFREDDYLKKVEFLGGNELVIGGYAFYTDKALETVIMGEGIIEIGEDAFSGCTSLKNVQLSPTLKKIDGYAFMYSGLTEIELPSSVETLERYAFSHAENLKTIKLNEGLKTIDFEALDHLAVEELTIPSTVEKIDTYGIRSCEKLKKITFLGKDTPIGGVISKDCVICGYEGSTAQEYAEKNGYTFEVLGAETPTEKPSTEPAQEIMLGDADESGAIDILDVITVNKAILGKENLSENGLKAIDFNGNGKPDSDEAMQVLKFIVGMIENFNA